MSVLKRGLLRIGCASLLLAAGVMVAASLSPWPVVGLVRVLFGMGADAASTALAPKVPAGVITVANLAYAPPDPDALLDLHRPAGITTPLPVVVWVHGGAWVSGSRADVAAYGQILASHGFAVLAVGYSLGPAAHHPTPVRQVNAALQWLSANAERYGLDAQRVVLAGDSAGAQISAQLATALSDPRYAAVLGVQPGLPRSALRGAVLFCGPYDLAALSLQGPLGSLVRTVLWAYSGRKDFAQDQGFALASVLHQVSGSFPPAFVSVGNADPLRPQSEALAARLSAQGVAVDTLFFEPDQNSCACPSSS